jgi:phage terminase large subunit
MNLTKTNEKNRVKLRFNWKLFNPNFHHIEREFRDTSRRFIWCYGGSSSAKTYSVSQAVVIVGSLIEGSDTLIFRKVSATLESTIYKDVVGIIRTLKLEQFFKINYRKITCINGAVIDFKGLDDNQKIKGISGYKRVVMDEISEMDFADFKQIRKRLRGRLGQQIICMFNPIDEEHWIKKEVFDKQKKQVLSNSLVDRNGVLKLDIDPIYTEVTEKWEGAPLSIKGVERPSNIVVIKSTYLNNFWVVGSPCQTFGFVDEQTIMDFEQDKVNDWDFYAIYGLGEWGKLNKGGEMYKNFDVKRHVKPWLYDPEKSLHLTFDENVNPFMTLDIHQAEGLKAWQIDEICLEDPRNTLNHTLREFNSRYEPNGMTVFVYGDATSKKADVKLEKGVNFFVLIENALRDYGYTVVRRVPSKNPNVELRCNWFNAVLNGLDGIEVSIGDNCTKTIGDYKYLKQASDGSKHKEKEKNSVTGVVFEKYGHNTDANDYFYTYYFSSSFENFGSSKSVAKAVIRNRTKKNVY